MDVGVDTHDFRPWHYDEVAGVMEKKSEAQNLTQVRDKSE